MHPFPLDMGPLVSNAPEPLFCSCADSSLATMKGRRTWDKQVRFEVVGRQVESFLDERQSSIGGRTGHRG